MIFIQVRESVNPCLVLMQIQKQGKTGKLT